MKNLATPFPGSSLHDPHIFEKVTDSGNPREEVELVEYNYETDLEDPNKVQWDSSYTYKDDGYNFDSTTFPISSPIPESPNYYGQLTPKEVMVSVNDEVIEPQPVRQRSHASGRSGGIGRGEEEVVVCSSNAAFKRNSTLMRTKTKSRLMDQTETDHRSSQKTPRSGIQSKGLGDTEEDEFSLDDLPEEYKKLRYNKWTLLQLISLILIIGILACTLAITDFRKKNLYDLKWWKWEVMILVVICGRLVSGWGIRILVFFIERSFLLRKRVLYFVYGLKKAVQNCIWLTLVLIAWECTFHEKVERLTYGKKVLPYVTKIWICLLMGTVFWLLKTLLIKVLALNFHVSKFFDRIQDSLFNQYLIESLSGPPVNQVQQEQEEEDWGMEKVEKLQSAGGSFSTQHKGNMFKGFRGNGKPDHGFTIDHLHRLNQKNISAWNMNRMMNVINRSISTTLDEQFQDVTCDEDEASMQITSINEAKIAAKKIFCNVAEPGSKHIYLEDLTRFLQDDEALKTIRLFDEASVTKGISKGALKNWVVNVFRDRRALALSLNDTKTAVDKLHQMLNVVVGIIIIVIWLLILKVATSQFFIFLSSQLVLVAFVFGNTCKTMFEAVIFLFIMHPFDVGDRCEIDGIQMVVEEMNILTTIFLRYDNQKISYPNSVLCTMPIANFHRSPDMGEAIDICIHVSTPTEKVAKMKERITIYVEKKSDHWQPEPLIVVRDVEDLNRLKISIWLSHRMNFQDMGERWKRRALLVEEMIKILKDLDIDYVEKKSDHWQPEPLIVVRDVEDLNRLKISIWLSHRMNFQDMGERWKRRALLVEEMIKILKDLDIEYRMLPLDINIRNIPGLASNRLPSNWTTCVN